MLIIKYIIVYAQLLQEELFGDSINDKKLSVINVNRMNISYMFLY